MESTLSSTTSAISKTLTKNSNSSAALISHLHRHYCSSFTRPTQSIIRSQLAFLRLRHTLTTATRRSNFNSVVSPSSSSLRGLTAASLAVVPLCRLRYFSSSAASFASGGGGVGGIGGGDGGGDGPADGREVRANAVPGGTDDVSALSSDVIILDVGGMSCGGCAASVKRILESQPQVSSAIVNLTTETATVWPISEAKVAPNWQKNLGDELAKHLTTCGFKSNRRGEAATEGEILS